MATSQHNAKVVFLHASGSTTIRLCICILLIEVLIFNLCAAKFEIECKIIEHRRSRAVFLGKRSHSIIN